MSNNQKDRYRANNHSQFITASDDLEVAKIGYFINFQNIFTAKDVLIKFATWLQKKSIDPIFRGFF